MMRFVVGIMALGLIFGLLLGCQLKTPPSADQIQESSSTLSISDDGSSYLTRRRQAMAMIPMIKRYTPIQRHSTMICTAE
jgi:hypothetical protein